MLLHSTAVWTTHALNRPARHLISYQPGMIGSAGLWLNSWETAEEGSTISVRQFCTTQETLSIIDTPKQADTKSKPDKSSKHTITKQESKPLFWLQCDQSPLLGCAQHDIFDDLLLLGQPAFCPGKIYNGWNSPFLEKSTALFPCWDVGAYLSSSLFKWY